MKKVISLLGVIALIGCSSESKLKEDVARILEENPEILTRAIQKNPADFIEAFQKAMESARSELAKRRRKAEEENLAEYFDKPLVPNIRKDEAIRGTKGAPLLLVEYSDFECSFCARGFNTIMALMEKYEGKLQFVYKHLPLSFHPNAMVASQYYEAIRLQSEQKAFIFHDEIFKNQSKLKLGEKFLKQIAKKLGLNMKRLAKDVKSKVLKNRILQDQKEAAKFGMQGTPGFILNGVPIRGARPINYFVNIINKLKKKGKVKL